MKKSIIFVLFFSICINVNSQKYDISGYWSGILTQPNSVTALASQYPFSMNISQSGDSIWGTSRIEISKTTNYAIIEFSGTISRNIITFQETKIIEQNIKKSAFWCIKSGSLKYNLTSNSLEGNWNSTGNCGPGKIFIQKFQNQENSDDNQQENEITEDITNNQVAVSDSIPEIEIIDNKLIINNIYFSTGKYDLSEIAKTEINKIYKFMVANKDINIFISGHTDNVGDELQLQELSEQRVEAVKNYLVEKGIDKNRISGKGFGGTQPISTGDTEADHAKNRRIEFEIIH